MTTGGILPDWVEEAAQMPIAFAQVREDPMLDLMVLNGIGGRGLRGIMIASGGCTAAALAANGNLGHLHLVDMNPAQIALCRVKLHLLQHARPLERMKILGHAPMTWESRSAALDEITSLLGLKRNALGDSRVTKLGPDHAGRYELLFSRLREEMREFAERIKQTLSLADASARIAEFSPDAPLGRAMDETFDSVMGLPNLVRLFGAQATQNSVKPFSRHFAGRVRRAIAAPSATTNPYLWQMMIGRFPKESVYWWLAAVPPRRSRNIVMSIDSFDNAIGAFRGDFDFVHLSNILDWLSPDEARHTLELAWKALRPGGMAIIRQLNSSLEFAELGPQFEWLADLARILRREDRSFFYRKLHLGRKR